MYEHSCAKAGAGGCGSIVRAGSEDELEAKVIEHARKKHGVPHSLRRSPLSPTPCN